MNTAGTEPESFYDVFYFGDDWDAALAIEKAIHRQFPDLKVGDASDGIHSKRFAVSGDVDPVEFYLFVIDNDFARSSLMLGLYTSMPQEPPAWIKEINTALEARAVLKGD